MCRLVCLVLLTVFATSVFASLSADQQVKSLDRRWLLSRGHTDACKSCFECQCYFKNQHHCTELHIFGINCTPYEPHIDCNVGFRHTVSQWTGWGRCHGHCSRLGTRNRHRRCQVKNCATNCTEPLTDSEPCHMPACATHKPTVAMTTATTTVPTIPSSTSVATTTTPVPTTPSTTPTPVPAPAECQKLCTIAAIANDQKYKSTEAPSCPDMTQTTPEALLLECCNTSKPSQWTRGANVMSRCGQTYHYAPVGRFDQGHYQPGSAGVFVECSEDRTTGFLMALQTCNVEPTLEHVTNNGTTKLDHPELYFFINN